VKLVTTMSSLRLRKRTNTRILLGDAYVYVVNLNSTEAIVKLHYKEAVLCETKAATVMHALTF
jgi:hypothetical protein